MQICLNSYCKNCDYFNVRSGVITGIGLEPTITTNYYSQMKNRIHRNTSSWNPIIWLNTEIVWDVGKKGGVEGSVTFVIGTYTGNFRLSDQATGKNKRNINVYKYQSISTTEWGYKIILRNEIFDKTIKQ